MESPNNAVVASVSNILKPTRTKAAGLSLWLLGLFLLFFARSPFQPTLEDYEQYEEKSSTARLRDEEKRSVLDEQLFEINHQLQFEKVWFWWLRSPYKDTVPPLLKERKQLLTEIRALDRELKSAMAEAKSHIGLWSNQGIQESRDVLWSAFRSGSDMARRRSFWDSIYIALSDRNENAAFTVMRLIATFVLNYSIAFLFSLLAFAFRIWWVIGSFQPNLVSAIAFYVVAVFSALSFFALVIGGIYAAGIGGIYVVAVQAQNRRLEYQQRHSRIHTRAHYD